MARSSKPRPGNRTAGTSPTACKPATTMCRSTCSRRLPAAEARAVRRRLRLALLAPHPPLLLGREGEEAEVAEEARREPRVCRLARLRLGWVVAAVRQRRRLRACSDRCGWWCSKRFAAPEKSPHDFRDRS